MASNSGRPLRPLLPARRPADRQPSRLPNDNLRPAKRQRKAACIPCRERKSKCDGEQPTCGECWKRSISCLYTGVDNAMSKKNLQTQVQTLNSRLAAFEKFMDMLKNVPEPSATVMLEHVRAGKDVEALLEKFTEADLLMQLSVSPETRRRYDFPYSKQMPSHLLFESNTYLDSVVYNTTFSRHPSDTKLRNVLSIKLSGHTESMIVQDPYEKPFQAAQLADPVLEKLDVSKWTTVISDNRLLRRYLGAYFMHLPVLSPVMHKDLFYEDMAAGGTRFASKLLVNVILTSGCQSCHELENRSKLYTPDNLAYKFLNEAKRLWELEPPDKAQLTTVQASIVMNILYNLDGKDFIAVKYLEQACEMAKVLDLFGPSPHSPGSKMYKARAITAWALYCRHMALCLTYSRPLQFQPPDTALPDPSLDPGFYAEIYVQYPPSKQLVPLKMGHKMYLETELYTLLSAMYSVILPEQRLSSPLDQALRVKEKLDRWYARMSKIFDPRLLVFPIHLHLHAQYYFWLIKLFEPLVNQAPTSAPTRLSDNPQEVRRHSLAMLETILRIYFIRHSYEALDSWIIHLLIVLGTDAIKSLYTPSPMASQLSADTLRSTIILAIKGLEQQSKNVYVAKMTALALIKNMRAEDAQLVQTYLCLEPVSEHDQGLMDENTRCLYPMPIVTTEGRVETKGLGELVKGVEELSLEREDESDGSAAA